MPKGIGVTDEGKKFRIAEAEEDGLVPCIGEAHSNPYIDNCLLCAPRWGKMMSYKKVPLSKCLEGFAVRYNDTISSDEDEKTALKAFFDAEREGKIKLTTLTEKTPAQTTNFFAWIPMTGGAR